MADNKYSKTGVVTKIITDAPDHEDRFEFVPDDLSRTLRLPISVTQADNTVLKVGAHITISPQDINTGKPIPYADFVKQIYHLSHPSETKSDNSNKQFTETQSDNKDIIPNRQAPNFDLNKSRNNQVLDNLPQTQSDNKIKEKNKSNEDVSEQSTENINSVDEGKKKKPTAKDFKRQAKSDHIVLGLAGFLGSALELGAVFTNMVLISTVANVFLIFAFVYGIFTLSRTRKYAKKFAVLALIILLISLALFGINIPVMPVWGMYIKIGLGIPLLLCSLLDMVKRASILLDENTDE